MSEESIAASSALKLPITHPGQVCYERILEDDEVYGPTDVIHESSDPKPQFAVVAFPAKIWKKKDLNVYFMEKHHLEAQIMEWASEWSKYCGVQFHKIATSTGSDIRVSFSKGGSFSYVGTDAKRKAQTSYTMNLGFIDKATVLHEFGHALGLGHGHKSPFSTGFEWNKEAVIKSLRGPPTYWSLQQIEEVIFEKYKMEDCIGTVPHTKSIMHFSFPAEWIKGNGTPLEIERNEELSDQDKSFIRKLYGPPRPPFAPIVPGLPTGTEPDRGM